MNADSPKLYFFCGIGGSGMLPLAIILKGLGHEVHGSDRSYDQGRTPEKFDWIRSQGITLFPQDGSGITPDIHALVISTAVEESIPDVAHAQTLNVPIRKRAEILAYFFNRAKTRIAIAGTSGKTTTTGMAGFLLKEYGLDPVVMNGGIFRNYSHDNPYATALVGAGDVFVTEADESDGSIALYEPDIALVHNITLDHKPLPELKQLFGDFLNGAKTAIVNLREDHVGDIIRDDGRNILSYSIDPDAGTDLGVKDIIPSQNGISAIVVYKGEEAALVLNLPGLHNLSNALAAIAIGISAGIPLKDSVEILARFEGIKRRMEVVGIQNEITVMDDFAHNPDKIDATLKALKAFPGRLIVFFQPHGYGFLKLTWKELAQTFARNLTGDDRLYLVEPLYLGGTADRSIGASDVVAELNRLGTQVSLEPSRDAAGKAMNALLQKGDRVIVMGARDDTLSDFAKNIYNSIT